MNYRIIVLLLATMFTCVQAQAFKDSIIVRKDARLDILAAKQASINRLTAKLTSSGKYKGFRLQVLNTRNRDEAFKIKAELLQRFPDQKAYIIFQSPNFKVRFGDYPDLDNAEKNKKLVAAHYTQGIYVIQDAIDYIPKDTADTSQ